MFNRLRLWLIKILKLEPVKIETVVLVPLPNESPWVMFHGHRFGVIHHFKEDGKLGVRPVRDDGKFFPSLNSHWTEEQRMRHPEEYSLHHHEVRAPKPHEIPENLRIRQ